jgi:hypothetical protein
VSDVCCGGTCCAEGQGCTGDFNRGMCATANGDSCSTSSECASGLCCGNVCIAQSNENCGTCGNQCNATTQQCAVTLNNQFVPIGVCQGLSNTPCTDGSQCLEGFCYNNVCCDECGSSCGQPKADGTNCITVPEPSVCCGGICTATNTTQNCGTCGNICSFPNVCTSGSCVSP